MSYGPFGLQRPKSGIAPAVLALALTLSLAHAESTGIVISKDEGDIKVTIDKTRYPDLKIQRFDKKMVITAPNGASKMEIDNALKGSGLVSVSESGNGRTVTINSDNVYLDISENAPEEDKPAPRAATPRPASKPLAVRPVEATIEEAKPAPAVSLKIETPRQSAKRQQPEQAARPAPSAVSAKPETPRATSATHPRLASEPEKLARQAEQAQTEQNRELPASTGETTETTQSNVAPLPADQQPLVNADNQPLDPESIPLDTLDRERQSHAGEATGMMMRMIAGLLVVLGLLFAFLKIGLPKLMERYPDYFEKLRRKANPDLVTEAEQSDYYEDEDLREESAPTAKKTVSTDFDDLLDEAKSRRRPAFFERFAENAEKPAAEPRFKPAKPPAKTETRNKYLTHLSMGSESFNVLSTTKIGKGKELHLVEVRGRELVIATTPYTVTLVADLSNASAQPRQDWIDATSAATPNTRAYLVDGQGQNGNDGKQSADSTRKFSALERNAGLYQKYLDDETGRNQFIDAEEVVILEDYDDEYRV